MSTSQPENVRLNGNEVIILDQTALPNSTVYLTLKAPEDFFDAIYTLKVRGAPAIGICAAFGIYALASSIGAGDYGEFLQKFREHKAYLDSSRPTAVNLSWALNRMEQVVLAHNNSTVGEIIERLRRESIAIQDEDIRMCHAIAGHGLTLLKEGDGVLTHCNAGPLATSLYGTALGPILLAQEQGIRLRIFADETRPLLQGARLTSYELHKAGVDVTLICDNMAGIVMKNGWINACFVGCDRIARNGDTANKIGTSVVAVLARHYGIPFYVLGPTSTIDPGCKTGDDIVIEEREPAEIREKHYSMPMAPAGVKCYNPAFDVTDHSLITAIITEHGITYPPFEKNITKLFTIS